MIKSNRLTNADYSISHLEGKQEKILVTSNTVTGENEECKKEEFRTKGYMIRTNIRYNKNLEWRQFLATSGEQILGIVHGQPGMCFDTHAPNAEDVECGVAKELIARCLKSNLVNSKGAIDIKAHMLINSKRYDENMFGPVGENMDLATVLGSKVCDVLVHVYCPYRYHGDKDAQRAVDRACWSYFSAARENGYDYGFFCVSL